MLTLNNKLLAWFSGIHWLRFNAPKQNSADEIWVYTYCCFFIVPNQFLFEIIYMGRPGKYLVNY